MISMLYFELSLIRRRKLAIAVLLFFPIFALLVSLIGDRGILLLQLTPLLIGWLVIGHILSMKRYRQFESLFSLSVTPRDIFMGNLLTLAIYYIYTFLIYLPIYLADIGCMIELRILFLLVLLLMGTKCLAIYLTMLIRRIYLISWATMLIYMLAFFSLGHIQVIAEHPYAWMVLPISLVAIAITYMMTTRLSKERVILSSE